MLLKILIFSRGCGGRTNIFKPHFKMAKAAAKVNSSFLKDILKLTASQPQELQNKKWSLGGTQKKRNGGEKKNENWSGKAKHALSQKKAHQP